MTITCQLCEKIFDKIISSTHLKFSHQISSEQYRQKFGRDSLACADYKKERSLARSGEKNGMFGKKHAQASLQKMSEKREGQIPSNKGKKVTDPDHLENLRNAVAARTIKWQQNDTHPRKGAILSPATRNQIRQGVQDYAHQNPELMQQRAAKAKQTLHEQGYDFGSHMRGKKHSQTTKNKISASSRMSALKKSMLSHDKMLQAISDANLLCESVEGQNVFVKCIVCNNQFSITKQYFTISKWRKDICPVCRPIPVKSNAELELLFWIRSVLPHETVLSGNRSTIFPLELDILIPHRNLAVEYCGLYWHSELQGKDKNYHKNKKELCAAQGISLITVFEDEWLTKQDIVKSRLQHLLGKCHNKIAARKCVVKPIDAKIARDFCTQNHIQGSGASKICLGLYYGEQLIQVATFSQPNISKGSRNTGADVWELSRLCSITKTQVMGGAGKLFKYFVTNYNPKQIISYCDLRWNQGTVYEQLGFTCINLGTPNYWYFKGPDVTRLHRFSLRKNSQDDPALTEWENRKAQGWNRIWDCGSSKWIWLNEKPEQ
jgi:hypothetical protein